MQRELEILIIINKIRVVIAQTNLITIPDLDCPKQKIYLGQGTASI
jgi:hypothetical protein